MVILRHYGNGEKDYGGSSCGAFGDRAKSERERHYADRAYWPATGGGIADVRSAAAIAGKSSFFAYGEGVEG